jgi:hypothetical protein
MARSITQRNTDIINMSQAYQQGETIFYTYVTRQPARSLTQLINSGDLGIWNKIT